MKRNSATLLLSLIVLLDISACSSIEYNSTNSPKMVVSVDHTPFYHNGPLQGNGPDLSLAKGEELEVLRKEIGYSFVRINDGQNGYVANDDLKPTEPAPFTHPTKATHSTTSATPTGSPAGTNASGKPGFRY